MSLLARIQQNQCAVRLCARERAPDSDVCRSDLAEKWANRLDRQDDGTYLRRRELPVRDMSGWLRAA